MQKKEKEREDILRSINVHQNRLNLAPALDQELSGMMREYNAKKEQVGSLENKRFNSQMAANAMANQNNDIFKILDEANLPERPMFPSRFHILLIGIGISPIVGIAGAFAREAFESSIANEEQAAAALKFPVLASIPEISQNTRL